MKLQKKLQFLQSISESVTDFKVPERMSNKKSRRKTTEDDSEDHTVTATMRDGVIDLIRYKYE